MIYLASGSPRRAELLVQIGVTFLVLTPDIDESERALEFAQAYVARMAREKAQEGVVLYRRQGWAQAPVLAADTIVVCDGVILHKPDTPEQAYRALRRLSGRTHTVHTALCLVGQSTQEVLSSSVVTFKTLTDAEIESYCATGEPLGKAGAYAIQGRGALFVSHMAGSYSGIMGLPLYECGRLLKAEGIV